MNKALLTLMAIVTLNMFAYAQAPRKIVLEDYTGGWCGFCPDGTTIMNNLIAGNSNVIGVANHNGDALANSYTNAIDQGLDITAYPGGSIDRFKFPAQTKIGLNRGLWTSYSAQRLAVTSPCNVNITSNFNSTTRLVDVNIKVDFVAGATAPLGGEFRLSCVLTEDGITGVPQQNYMGQGCNSPNPNSAWYNYPCVISNFVHDHTARVNISGHNWGDPLVIPTSVSAGETFSKNFSYTVPTNWDASKMKVLAFVSRHHPTDIFQRDMLNANQTSGLNAVTSIEIVENGNLVSSHAAFPNPAVYLSNVEFQLNKADHISVKIFNALGQEVSTLIDRNLTPGLHSFIWDTKTSHGVPAHDGLYIYEIRSSEGSLTGKIMLNR